MLYYTVAHNVTVSGSVEVEHITNLSILLSGTKPGLIYLVTVLAVNAVGEGMNTSDTCTVTTTGQTCYFYCQTEPIYSSLLCIHL